MENKAIYEEIGKTLAPVEIDGKGAMEVFGITYKDLVPFVVGATSILIYPYPASPEVCEELLRDLRQKYSKQSRSDRCMIHGVYGRLRVCPEKYSCPECPFGQEEKIPRSVSLEAVQEDGVELEDRNSGGMSQVEADLFLEYLEQLNPQYARILVLTRDGYSEMEITQMLQVSRNKVTYAKQKIRRIAERYFGFAAR